MYGFLRIGLDPDSCYWVRIVKELNMLLIHVVTYMELEVAVKAKLGLPPSGGMSPPAPAGCSPPP